MDISIDQCVEKFRSFLLLLRRISTAKTFGSRLRALLRWLDEAGLMTEDGIPITRNSPMQVVNKPEIIAAFYAFLATRRTSDGRLLHNNTQLGYGQACRALWDYCCDGSLWAPDLPPLTWNACKRVPMAKHVASHRDQISIDQGERILDACHRLRNERGRILAYAIMQVFFMAGLRRCELIGLEVTDYNREKRTLYVRNAKGGKPRYQRIDSDCCAAIDKWLSVRGTYIRGRWVQTAKGGWTHVADESAPNHLFTTSLRKHVSNTSITRLFERLERVGGLPNKTVQPHKIRHLQATRVYQQAGIRAAQRFCGHQSEQTTWHYVRPTTDSEMDQVLGAVQPRPTHNPVNTPEKQKKQVSIQNEKHRRRFHLRDR